MAAESTSKQNFTPAGQTMAECGKWLLVLSIAKDESEPPLWYPEKSLPYGKTTL